MEMTLTRRWRGLSYCTGLVVRGALFAIIIGACTSSPESIDTLASQYLPDGQGTWSTPIAYNENTSPRAVMPEGGFFADGVVPPLQIEGMDTGQPGVMYAAGLAGYFLLRMQQSDGSYQYEYRPDTGEFLWEDVIHRQIGPGYAVALLYEELQREEFRRSAEWVFEYAMPRVAEAGASALRITDIGATSIFVFGLSRLVRSGATNGSGWEDTLRGLGQHLLDLQTASGGFSEGSPLARGQALQALSHLWLTFKEPVYLDALQRSARYSCDTWQDINPDYLPYFILYANEGLATLYEETGDAYLPECVYDMTEINLLDQYQADDTPEQSWVGGFNKLAGWTPSWSAALKLEAIADALRIARLDGVPERQEQYEERLRLGIPFVMRFQWRVGETEGWPQSETVLGGFPYLAPGSQGALAWPLSRTDLAWHGIAFFIKAARMLGEETWPSYPDSE